MSTRWVFLAITLLCMASCSFIAGSSSANLIAPLGAVVFGVLSLVAFISDRVEGASRGDSGLMSDPETLRMLSERAKATAARNSAAQAQQNAQAKEGNPPQ